MSAGADVYYAFVIFAPGLERPERMLYVANSVSDFDADVMFEATKKFLEKWGISYTEDKRRLSIKGFIEGLDGALADHLNSLNSEIDVTKLMDGSRHSENFAIVVDAPE